MILVLSEYIVLIFPFTVCKTFAEGIKQNDSDEWRHFPLVQLYLSLQTKLEFHLTLSKPCLSRSKFRHKIAKTRSMLSKNVNTTIRKYSSRAFI